MKSTNRKRALILSSSMILLCTVMIIGVSFALFTDTQTVTNHLRAGDLDITLNRIGLTKTVLNDQGYLDTVTLQTASDDPVPFSGDSRENVFGLLSGEKIVPGSKYQATMQIENNSDVAFGYWIEIKCSDETKAGALANQLKVTVNTGEAIVANGLMVGDRNNHIGVLTTDAGNNSATFTVTVEFLDSGQASNGLAYYANDNAKNQSMSFDLIVHAVQVTNAAPPI